jgi:ubiquinone/menaquinone biosynthesis C-methylase UbiE/uncharacterized protein YbaR (Trm112 family)
VARLLVCPRCRAGSLEVGADDHGRAVCGACAAAYPLRGGVIDLLPDRAPRRSIAQRAMESDTVVRIYESRLWRRSLLATLGLGISFEREQEIVLAAANPPRDGAVLDLACGPGIYTRPLARRVAQGSVIGLDLSLPMLSYAARRAAAEGLGNAIFVRASALELPLRERTFDVVNCCGALHLFPDVPKAIGEVARVLAPGGRFTAAVFRSRGEHDGDRASAIGVHAFRDGELETLLEKAGFAEASPIHGSRRWSILCARK